MKTGGIPLSEWSGSKATDQLHATIKEFQIASAAQTDAMLRLTKAMTWLTVIMAVGMVVQIYLTIVPLK